MKKLFGFSLIEILITIVVFTIIAAIAIPLYSKHIAQTNRLEAEITLEKLATAMEGYFTRGNTYEKATLDNLNISQPKHYEITITQETDSDFTLTARPLDTNSDTDCGTLTLNSAGQKGVTGSAKVEDCW